MSGGLTVLESSQFPGFSGCSQNTTWPLSVDFNSHSIPIDLEEIPLGDESGAQLAESSRGCEGNTFQKVYPHYFRSVTTELQPPESIPVDLEQITYSNEEDDESDRGSQGSDDSAFYKAFAEYSRAIAEYEAEQAAVPKSRAMMDTQIADADIAALFILDLFKISRSKGTVLHPIVNSFILYAHRRADLPESVLYTALYLLWWRKNAFCRTIVPLSSSRCLRVQLAFSTAYMLCAKMLVDHVYNLKSWTVIFQQVLGFRELNELEREIWKELEYEIRVDKVDLAKFQGRLRGEYYARHSVGLKDRSLHLDQGGASKRDDGRGLNLSLQQLGDGFCHVPPNGLAFDEGAWTSVGAFRYHIEPA